jgi:hypothetical protein
LPERRFPPPLLTTFRAEGFVLIYFQRFASTDVAMEAQRKISDADDPPGAVA